MDNHPLMLMTEKKGRFLLLHPLCVALGIIILFRILTTIIKKLKINFLSPITMVFFLLCRI